MAYWWRLQLHASTGKLSGSSAGRAAGLYNCTLYNCTVDWATDGGAYGSTLYNCTVTGNSAMAWRRGFRQHALQLHVTGNSSGAELSVHALQLHGQRAMMAAGCYWRFSTLYNSIVYYNSGGNYAEGTILNYSCTTPLPTNGVGNITGPPLFMDMAAGDFRLREESPCIDAGTNLMGFPMIAMDMDS